MSEQQHPDRKSNRVLGVAQIIGSNTEGRIFNLSAEGVGFIINDHFERFIMDRTYTLMLKFEKNEEFPEGLFLTVSGIVRHKMHDELMLRA